MSLNNWRQTKYKMIESPLRFITQRLYKIPNKLQSISTKTLIQLKPSSLMTT